VVRLCLSDTAAANVFIVQPPDGMEQLRRCCHVDMTAKGGCVSGVRGVGGEGDTGTARNTM
jgi:hypothetical protein